MTWRISRRIARHSPRGGPWADEWTGELWFRLCPTATYGTPGAKYRCSYRTRNRTDNGASSGAGCEENHRLCHFTGNLLFCGPRYSPCNSPCLAPSHRSSDRPGDARGCEESNTAGNRPSHGPSYGPCFQPSHAPGYWSSNLPRVGASYFTGYKANSEASSRGDCPVENVVIALTYYYVRRLRESRSC
jgi:hypothetical protein